MATARRSRLLRAILLMFMVVYFCPLIHAKVIYVDDNASGADDGTGWDNAYVYLQDALADANDSEKPVEIHVARGVYTPDCGAGYLRGDKQAKFLLKSAMTLKGGFAGIGAEDPDAWDCQVHETVLSGDLDGNDDRLLSNFTENSDHVICCIEGDASTVLEGFTITGGYATDRIGGGLLNYKANPMVRRCVFFDNYASQGGGMANRDSSPTVIDCTFSGNLAPHGGGGMYNTDQSHPTVESCIFHDNRTTLLGGGGMYCGDSNPTLAHCLFVENGAPFGGGMYNAAANPVVINCTFANNRATAWGAGMQNEAGAQPIVANCIFWGNTPDQINTLGWPSIAADVTYSDVQGGHAGAGNIDSDPLFADPIVGDYHLRSTAGRWEPTGGMWMIDEAISPCIDAGDPNSPAVSEPSPHGCVINMGAYGGTAEASKSPSVVVAKYGGGCGAAWDPYLIRTAEQMNEIGLYEEDWGKHFKLVADIDLSSFGDKNPFNMIAPDANDPVYRFEGTPFTGVFDGNGHTISHTTISGEGFLGLFGRLESGAEVRDLGVTGVSVRGSHNHVGGLVGYNYGVVTRCYSTGTVRGKRRVGGLVGMNQGSVTNCYSTARVNGEQNIGGLVGDNNLDGKLVNCYSTGEVKGLDNTGGLVGFNCGYVIGCFWDTQTSCQVASGGGRGLITVEMMDPEILGLHRLGGNPHWMLDSGRDYPRLVWEGTPGQMVPEPVIDWLDGLGTQEDPFQIENADQLLTLDAYSFFWDKHFVLNADIDLDPSLPGRFVLERAVIPTFEGSFAGNGHVILNLHIQGGSGLGFFRKLTESSVVRDLYLENVSIRSDGSNVGGLAGSNEGHVLNCYSAGEVTGSSSIGGLVGNNFGDMTYSHSSGLVSGDEDNVGGLVGINNGDLSSCNSIATVRGDKRVGGLAGWNGMRDTVSFCFSTGVVSGSENVGGLLGSSSGGGKVVQCYSTCAVEGDSCVGGLVGYNGADVTKCYSTGLITGGERSGGLMGHNWGEVTACVWNIETSGLTNMCGTQEEDVQCCIDSCGRTTAQMHVAATFGGWISCCAKDQVVWTIDEGNDYPRLWWENAPGHAIEPTGPCLMHATNPSPPDGTVVEDTWVSLSWSPGVCATSHEVYFGDSFEHVNDGTGGTFLGNRTLPSYDIGLPGFVYSDGLIRGTTYYWRIDEVNDTHPDSPWRGDVWSFTIPCLTAHDPSPSDADAHEDTTASLEWSPGYYAESHDVYFGDNFEDVNHGVESTFQGNQVSTSLIVGSPGSPYPDGLTPGTTYYWRVDEVNPDDPNSPWEGDVWSFRIPPYNAYNPNPPDGAESADPNVSLTWIAGLGATWHAVYFGDNFDDINDATGGLPQPAELTAYEPGALERGKTYYWRVDEINDLSAESPSKGKVWSFTTADFIVAFVVDDFEAYTDYDGRQIWRTWIDGFDVPDNGSQVGYLIPPYAERTIVHGGHQSMPLFYDNAGGVTISEAVRTFNSAWDWTVEGADTLTLYYRGEMDNDPENLYVAIEDSAGQIAMVNHQDAEAVLATEWQNWHIALADIQATGVDTAAVKKICIGLGDGDNLQSVGAGKIYIDDIWVTNRLP